MIRPILFSGDMVRAILDGRKTETRRPVKPCKDVNFGCELSPGEIAGEVNQGNDYQNCPYGRPGDLLWVRETCWVSGAWRPTKNSDSGRFVPLGPVAYHANQQRPDDKLILFHEWRVTPSIHMPRWACRLVLEVVSVRVEWVQEITEEGAKAEGVLLTNTLPDGMEGLFRPRFAGLWDSIYATKGLSWNANPWVWVVGFKVAAVGNEAAQAVMRAAA
ncbi:hypothetical protein [Desulfovibrio aminophilus]|uniref:hypothetical protein n=1 Tax=Desulfovibrio aminophilus TaxID=81425 RepID=UPI000685B4A4|nr:hypothetical protein [Desulfovibrio aminophilus]